MFYFQAKKKPKKKNCNRASPLGKKAQHQSVNQTQSKEKKQGKANPRILIKKLKKKKNKKKKQNKTKPNILKSKTNGKRMKERKKPNLKSKEKNLTHKPNILSSRTPEPTDCRIEEGDCQVGEGARIDLPRLDVLPESRRHYPSTSSLPAPSTSRYFISVSVSLSLHLKASPLGKKAQHQSVKQTQSKEKKTR